MLVVKKKWDRSKFKAVLALKLKASVGIKKGVYKDTWTTKSIRYVQDVYNRSYLFCDVQREKLKGKLWQEACIVSFTD